MRSKERQAVSEERRDGVYEVKFPVPSGAVEHVLGWVRTRLEPDPHGTGEFRDLYDVRSLYLDTPSFDVYHRRGSFGRAKFRVRRYGEGPVVFLERKLKRGGMVRKRRMTVEPGQVAQLGGGSAPSRATEWFQHRLELRGLRPVVMMNYRRVARQGREEGMPFRVTLDQALKAVELRDFEVPRPIDAPDLLENSGILEIKFATVFPACLRAVVADLGLKQGGFSKYRLGVCACGLVPAPTPAASPSAEPLSMMVS